VSTGLWPGTARGRITRYRDPEAFDPQPRPSALAGRRRHRPSAPRGGRGSGTHDYLNIQLAEPAQKPDGRRSLWRRSRSRRSCQSRAGPRANAQGPPCASVLAGWCVSASTNAFSVTTPWRKWPAGAAPPRPVASVDQLARTPSGGRGPTHNDHQLKGADTAGADRPIALAALTSTI
jgi:hypothetical protein